MIRVLIVCISLGLTACVSPHQLVDVQRTIPYPLFSVKEAIEVEEISVSILEIAPERINGIKRTVVWDTLAVQEGSATRTRSIRYGQTPAGFQEVVPAKKLDRGLLYQVGISGTERTHASGHFFFVRDERDESAVNVHFTGNVDELIACISEKHSRKELLAECRDEKWIIEGQENWEDRIAHLARAL